MPGDVRVSDRREPTWDERHELIEGALIAYLAHALGATSAYDDSVQSWFATVGGQNGLSMDVTDMASDINVALGPTPELLDPFSPATREASLGGRTVPG